jgi:CelD/BcsL family acetyltransferase involved in cellulose biosynthesis
MQMQPKSKTLMLDAAGQRLATASRTMTVVFIKNFEMLEDYIQAWEDLAVDALEPNPFYEPWMLMPALAGLAKGSDVRVVLVLTVDQGKPVLCGMFPLERRARYKGLPVAAFSLWRHIYCALCTPLIRRARARECLDAFLDWLESERECSLMDFNLIAGEGPFHNLLSDCLAARRRSGLVSERHGRAILRPQENSDLYLRKALRRDHRKDCRRKTRRLAELGKLEFDSLEFQGDVRTWIEEFLQLEASGWKGREGSAFACNESNRNYFAAMAKAAFDGERLMMLALRLDGKPVAMKCNFIATPGSFAFKIAFDEAYAEYSPGFLLEIENVRWFHAQRRFEWMDSCAAPDHPMIDRLWFDRLEIQSVLVPTGAAGKSVVAALPAMRSLNRKIRALSGGVSR